MSRVCRRVFLKSLVGVNLSDHEYVANRKRFVTLDLMCVFVDLTLHAQNVPPKVSEQALEDL